MIQSLDLPLLISSHLGVQNTIQHILSVPYAIEETSRNGFGGGVGTALREVFDVVQARLAGVLRVAIPGDVSEEV